MAEDKETSLTKLEVLTGLHSLLMGRNNYQHIIQAALHCVDNRQDEWWRVRRSDSLQQWVDTLMFVFPEKEIDGAQHG